MLSSKVTQFISLEEWPLALARQVWPLFSIASVMASKNEADTSHVGTSSTSAARRKSQPSSTVCAIPELFENLALLEVGRVGEFQSDSLYNLKKLCDVEQVEYEDIWTIAIQTSSLKWKN